MTTINTTAISGRLTRDAEIRTLPSGDSVANGCIAFDYGWGDKKQACFLDITLFGKTAEAFCKYCHKGDLVFLHGQLKYESWQSKDGESRFKILLIVKDWHCPRSPTKDDSKADGSSFTGHSSNNNDADYSDEPF
jgi:single-strand DNA-binding protein